MHVHTLRYCSSSACALPLLWQYFQISWCVHSCQQHSVRSQTYHGQAEAHMHLSKSFQCPNFPTSDVAPGKTLLEQASTGPYLDCSMILWLNEGCRPTRGARLGHDSAPSTPDLHHKNVIRAFTMNLKLICMQSKSMTL